MKVRLSDVLPGQCYRRGKELRKKLPDGRSGWVGAGGKVRARKIRGNPSVELVGCPLELLGLGLRAHSGRIMEIGRK